MNNELWRDKLEDVLASKVEEMHMLGYEAISADDIWECVTVHYKKEWPALHRVVNDIFRMQTTDIMNRLTMQAYQGKIDI